MKTFIVDVRSEKEFSEGSFPGAINMPVEKFQVSDFQPYRNEQLALVCFSGNRAERVKKQLYRAGFKHVTLLKQQMVHIEEGSKEQERLWTIDRQFRMAIGLFVGFYLLDQYWFHTNLGIGLLSIVFAGLIYSALTDNCYLKELLVRLPWNVRRKQTAQARTN